MSQSSQITVLSIIFATPAFSNSCINLEDLSVCALLVCSGAAETGFQRKQLCKTTTVTAVSADDKRNSNDQAFGVNTKFLDPNSISDEHG